METDNRFKDVQFMTAAEKQRVLNAWVRFVRSRFALRSFTTALYQHLTLHSGFIGHYSRSGFYAVYFEDPLATQKFLDQFDRSKGCPSVEFGGSGWMENEDYRDINGAMVDAAMTMMPALRCMLRERETVEAQHEFNQAERRLKEILKAG
jgi:hypothetical protein